MDKLLIIHLFNMSITASWIVLAVILLRLLLKKAPKAITVALWGLVGIRLLLPFSIESALSLIPSAETVPQEIVYAREPMIDSGITAINAVVNPIIIDSFAPSTELTSINPIQIFFAFAELIWIVGMIAMVLYTCISYLRLRLRVREAMPLRENIYVCDRIPTPFILGLFRPRIYLPASMDENDMEYVIAHEKAHLRRGDHLWKPLGFLLLTVYWFNPVLWVAYILLCRDIEFACDERVIRDMGIEDKKAYSTALLNCSIPRRMVSACPLAFGEVGVKQRIKSVLHYKKPAFWIIIVALIATVGIAICFLTNPKEDSDSITEDPLPPLLTVESTLAQVNVDDNTRLYMGALNRDKMYISSVQHLPIFKFESAEALHSYTELYGKEIDFSYKSSLSDAPSFADATAKYDDAFFAENTLFAIYIFAPQCDNVYKLHSTHVRYGEDLRFHITTERRGQLEATLEYMMLIEVNRKAVKSCTEFDAMLDAVDVKEETIVGTWETDGAVFVFREDGTGVEIIPTAKDRKFVYAVEGKFLTLTYTDVDETASDHFMQFSYEQTRDMMRLGDLRSSSFNDTLELTRISYDTPTPIDDVDLQSAGAGVWQFFRWPDMPTEPQEGIDTLSFSFENREFYAIARGEHLEYIDNLRLKSNADGTYTLSFQLFQDALPYIGPLFTLLNSTVTLSYEGETFDALDKANEHTVFLFNGEKASVTAVSSGAGNGHRDFYFTMQPAEPIDLEQIEYFEFVIS